MDSHMVKRVRFFGQDAPIFLQNENGPCPLLAIANVLSLRQQLKLSPDIPQIPQSRLITLVADTLLETSSVPEHASPETSLNLQQNLNDCFEVLGKLATGIDVNVRFHSCFGFEATAEVTVFDLLNISLVHGWLTDPADPETASVVGRRSYNELVEALLITLDDQELNRLSSSGTLSMGRSLSGLSGGLGHLGSSFRERQQHQQDTPQQQQNTPQQQQQQQWQVVPLLGLGGTPTYGGALGSLFPQEELDMEQDDTGSETPPPAGLRPQEAPEPAAAAVAAGTAGAAADTSTHQPEPAGLASPAAAADAAIGALLEELLAAVAADCGEPQPAPPPGLVAAAAATELPPPPSLPAVATSLPPPPAGVATSTAADDAGSTPPLSPVAAADVAEPEPVVITGQADLVRQASVVRDFLQLHCSQLTPYGLESLARELSERQLAVFFRNNHFSVAFKHGASVYLLVTDQGYAHEGDVVWERLDSVHGDTQLCGPGFQPFQPHREGERAAAQAAGSAAVGDGGGEAGGTAGGAVAAGGSGEGDAAALISADEDFALALQLQEQEEFDARQEQERQQQQQASDAAAAAAAAAASRQQQSQQQQHHPTGEQNYGSHYGRQSGPRPPARPAPTSFADRDKCCIM